VIHFKFPQPPPSGRMVVEAEGVAKSYGAKHVLNDVRFSIKRGDRVALVGVNGAGKSTLIRMLTGTEAPTAGQIKFGHNVVSEYFAQDQYKVLDGDARMLDDISRAAVKVPEGELRSLLGCFLFSGDDVFKQLATKTFGGINIDNFLTLYFWYFFDLFNFLLSFGRIVITIGHFRGISHGCH